MGEAAAAAEAGWSVRPFSLSQVSLGDSLFREKRARVVFCGVDSGVANTADPQGRSFLDRVWDGAPFPHYAAFLARVVEVGTSWEAGGLLTDEEKDAVLRAAREAMTGLAT